MAFPDASRSSLNCTIQLSCVDLLLINVVLVLPTAPGLFTPLCPWLCVGGVGVGKQQLGELGLLLL